jgi:histidine ammonia-lyase
VSDQAVSEQAVALDGARLAPDQVRQVARDGAPVRVDPVAEDRAAAAYQLVEAVAARQPVYGRTTGVGANRQVLLDTTDAQAPGLRLLRSHSAGGGEPLGPVLARAMLTVRLNQLAAGGSGLPPSVLRALALVLNRGLVPTVHRLGGIGTGDLAALADVALCLLGERPWRDGHLEAPVPFAPSGALGFLSSNALTLGEAALACADLTDLLAAGTVAGALAFLGTRGNPEAYAAAVHRARPHPGQVLVAGELRRLLDGQPLRPARIQDPYACRAMAQVHGAALDAHAGLDRVLAVELNMAGENPLVDTASGQVLHNANFHAGYLGLALDAVRLALYQTAALSAARTSALLEPDLTGLTPFLADGPAGSSGLMALEYLARAALAELRLAAAPAGLDTAVVSRGLEEHAPFAAQSAGATTRAVAAYRTVLAIELVTAVRAVRMGGSAPVAGPLGEAYRVAAAVLPESTVDRSVEVDVELATELLVRLRAY